MAVRRCRIDLYITEFKKKRLTPSYPNYIGTFIKCCVISIYYMQLSFSVNFSQVFLVYLQFFRHTQAKKVNDRTTQLDKNTKFDTY